MTPNQMKSFHFFRSDHFAAEVKQMMHIKISLITTSNTQRAQAVLESDTCFAQTNITLTKHPLLFTLLTFYFA